MICEIDRCQKTVGGKNTEYRLERTKEAHYEIVITRDCESVREEFYGSFFDIAELYKMIVETDTLPENLVDISQDIKSCHIM